MSALTDRIAAEHGGWFNLDGVWRCNCGEPLPSSANADMWMRAHITTVTEAAVRAHIAAALDDLAKARHDDLKETKRRTRAETFAGASAMAYELAARIARGVTP